MRKKIVLICNESETVINFRKELIEFLQTKDYEVYVIVGDAKRKSEIEKLNVALYVVPFSNRSTNPFSSFKLISSFKRILQFIKPNSVFTFQIKPNIFGTIAAHKAGIPFIYSMVEGLGDPFQPHDLKGRVLRKIVCLMYKKAFRPVSKVFFLNNDDINEFIDRKLISRELSVLIPGIGIDCKSYNFNPLVPKEKKVLMLSRLIVNKGILDYCKIAREIRKNRPDISFYLYGAESQLTVNDIIEFINDKSIIYGGYSTGASKLYQDCRLYVSCSYREGFPRVILEAMASGCPVIAYNVTGSNAVIDNNDTGVLLEPKNIDAFCKEIVSLIDDEKRLLFFKNKGRLVCEKKYDSSIVNNIIYKEID